MVRKCHKREDKLPPQTVKSPRAEAPQPNTPLAVGQGERLGRSPDLRVIAQQDLPVVFCTTVAFPSFTHRLQLRGQSRNICLKKTSHNVPF